MLEAFPKVGMSARALFKLLIVLFIPVFLVRCGPIEVSGGTSEVGNPATAIHSGREDDTTTTRTTGFGISAKGAPIRVFREKSKPDADSSNAVTSSDSTTTR